MTPAEQTITRDIAHYAAEEAVNLILKRTSILPAHLREVAITDAALRVMVNIFSAYLIAHVPPEHRDLAITKQLKELEEILKESIKGH